MQDWLIKNRNTLSNIIDFLFALSLLWLGCKGIIISNIYENTGIYNLTYMLSYLFIAIKFIYIFLLHKFEDNIEKIKDELEFKNDLINRLGSNLQIIIDDIMEEHFKYFNFNKAPFEERMTLYMVSGSSSFAISRTSLNPTLKTISSTQHSLEKGCIKYGYEHGFHFDNRFPCHTTNPTAYNNYLRQPQENFNYGFSKSDCKKLKNKSRVYAVKRIEKSGSCLGIIVLESLNPESFSEAEAVQALNMLEDKLGNILCVHKIHMDTNIQENLSIIEKKKRKRKSRYKRIK